jgi:hypothetical protein
MIESPTDEEFIRELTDAELLAAYQRTDGEGTQAERLCAEIERRGLDV